MHRNNLFKKLNLYSPQDSNELTMYNSLLQFIDKTPDCFNSKLDTGHITGSAWILDYKKNSVLLTHHKKLNKWLQLGGHADGDSDILSVAEREAEEESGLKSIKYLSYDIFDIDVHIIPRNQNTLEHSHYDIRFLFEANINEPLFVSKESIDLLWVSLNNVYKLNSNESISRMVNKSKTLT